MSVSNKTHKKIGLFTALSMLIGSVVGIGIFLKNYGVFQINNYDYVGILITWILGAIIALTTSYCFSEIGSSKKSRSGIAGWAEKLLGKKIGYLVKISFPLFYLSIMEVVLSIFLSESIFKMFDDQLNIQNLHYGYIALLGFLLMMLFLIFNFASLKVSGLFSSVTTILKFVPIIAIIIGGIVIAVINGSSGLFGVKEGESFLNQNGQTIIVGKTSFGLIISALPSVLFAFDSFTNIGNLALDIKKPEKNVPLTIIIGMILCSIFYIIFTISQILVINGNGLEFFNNKELFGEATTALTIILNIFIVISMSGVVNSFSAAIIRSFKSLFEEKVFFAYKPIERLSKKIAIRDNDNYLPGLILIFITSFIWFLIISIPSICIGGLGSDAFVDGISNFPTIFFFMIYGMLVLGAFVNRFTKKIEVQKQKLFFVAAPISIIGIAIIFCYLFFYQYLVMPFISDSPFSWGLFYDNGYVTEPWVASVWFFVSIIIFVGLPLLNYWLSKIFNKEYFLEKHEVKEEKDIA